MNVTARFGEVAGAALLANEARLRRATAEALRPPPRMSVADWAVRNRRFHDDAAIPGAWRHETAPELVEIMEALSPHDPCEQVAVMKCAQSGGSASAENWLGYISDLAPGPVLFVQSTFAEAKKWAAEKFWPMVEATPRLDPLRGGTIRAAGLGDDEGSTSQRILFSRSRAYIKLVGANSAAGLRQSTMRYAVEDDLDNFPDDLDGQGSPEAMVDERLKVWRSRGLSKRIKISTPTIKGSSKIGRAYRESDRRRFHLKCPGCGARFVPEWNDITWPKNPDRHEEAYMIAPCCGRPIEHWEKASCKLADGWLSDTIDGEVVPRVLEEEVFLAWRARMPASIRRGFHLPGEVSSFQSWSEMATGWRDAQGDVNRLKTWTNLKRGIEYEIASDRPDEDAMKVLVEQDWGRNEMPIGPVVTTLGVDVQGDGLYVELVGWGPRKESWQLDARFIPGATDVEGEGAWADLDALSKLGVRFPGGRVVPIDQECVDAGYHTSAAEAYCARRPRRRAVFGRSGWSLPVIGRGVALKYEKQGRRMGAASRRREDKAHIVGVNGVKLSWYGYLRASVEAVDAALKSGGAEVKPLGRVHLGRDVPVDWIEQATAEAITVRMVAGRPDRRWEAFGRPNHYLDCRVYGIAAAEILLLDRLGEADWARLTAERYAPEDELQGDLLAPRLPAAAKPTTPSPAPRRGGAPIAPRGNNPFGKRT